MLPSLQRYVTWAGFYSNEFIPRAKQARLRCALLPACVRERALSANVPFCLDAVLV